MKVHALFLACALATSLSAQAAVPSLNAVDETELTNVVKELSANFNHRTVSSAKSLGHLWGFEVGMIAGVTKTPKLEALVKEVDPSTNVDQIAHAALIGLITVPYAITAEVSLLPEKTISDVTVKSWSMGVKWTATDLFPVPVIAPWIDAALRLHYSSSDLSYRQAINNAFGVDANAEVVFDSKVWGMNAVVSSDILLFEPFIGVGFLKSDTDVSVITTTSATIFSTPTQGQESSPSSAHLFAGLQMDLFLFHLSAEVARAFDTTSYTGKLSFYF